MSNSVWIDATRNAIRSYSASVKGSVSIVRIEVECSTPSALAYLLEELARAQKAAQCAKDERAAAARAAKREEKQRRAIGRQKLLMLEDKRGDRS